MIFHLSVADIIIVTVTACVLLYMYATRQRNYWKKQNVPHEELSLIFGPIKSLLSKPLCLSDQERYKKMGRLFGIYERGEPILVVADPDFIKQVLVKDFQLLPNRLMNALIQGCARITCEHLKTAAERNDEIDVKRFYGHYSLDVIMRCAFGIKVDSHTDATNEFVTQANKAFSAEMSWKVLFGVLFPGLAKALRLRLARGTDPYEYFRSVSKRIINQRRQNGQRQEDFLQLMMDAQDGNLSASADTSTESESKLFDVGSEAKLETSTSPKRTQGLTELEALAQCVLFFIAGLETTSSTLAFAAYLLALHPEAQEKLRKEVDDCMTTHGPEPGLDVISKLKYMNCVVSETLRLYPPATRLERCGYDDYVLGDTGVKLPKECSVVIPVYAIHRDPELFPDPDSFKPERFSAENVESIRPYTYLPFGAGPRNCIGMRLALQSAKLCLLHSLHNVQFVRTKKTQVPLKIKKGLGVLTAEDITVGIRKRPDQK